MTNTETPQGDTYTARVLGDIRAEMARQGISQANLATRMHRGPDWISDRIGRNPRTAIDTNELEQFATVLGLDVDTLGRRR